MGRCKCVSSVRTRPRRGSYPVPQRQIAPFASRRRIESSHLTCRELETFSMLLWVVAADPCQYSLWIERRGVSVFLRVGLSEYSEFILGVGSEYCAALPAGQAEAHGRLRVSRLGITGFVSSRRAASWLCIAAVDERESTG